MKLNWFSLVLWHINHCWLFNAESGLFQYIRYIWFVNINQQNGSKYCYVSLTIHHSFVYTQLNNQTVLFQTIQFSISHLFALSLIVKYFHLTQIEDSVRCYHSWSEKTWERWQWRSTPHFPKLQHYWSLTIRLFSVIFRVLIEKGLTPPQRNSWCILQPQPTGWM